MHVLLLEEVIRACRQRQAEGDHPTRPPFSVEQLEDAVVQLADRVAELTPKKRSHCPPGLEEKSRELHREYNRLVKAQNEGANNAHEVIKLTDECGRLGIILVPGGENL